MTKNIIATLITLILIANGLYASTPERKAETDSISEQAILLYGTGEGMRLLDILEEKGVKYGDLESVEFAISYKLGAYINMGMYDRVEEMYDSIANRTRMEQELPSAYFYALYVRTMANIHQGHYRMAIENAQEIFKHSIGPEEVKGKEHTELDVLTLEKLRNRINALRCLGTSYGGLRQTETALTYLDEGVAVAETYPDFIHELADISNDRMQLAASMNDLERNLRYTRHLEDVIKQLDEEDENEELNISFYTTCVENSYVTLYSKLEDYQNATYHMMRLREMLSDPELMRYFRDKYHVAECAYNIAIKEYPKAIAYADTAAKIAERLGEKSRVIEIKMMRAGALAKMRNYKEAFGAADSIIKMIKDEATDQLTSAISEMSVMVGMNRLEMDKKKAESDRTMWVLVAIISFVGAVALIVGITTYQNRRQMTERQRILSAQKQVLLEEVEKQTSELREKNEIIEKKNTDITASINYALKIQKAMLPDMDKIVRESGLKGAYVFYRPCDIVSGDFYWAKKHDDGLVIVCADCTGHSVPGAMLSMTGGAVLNDITSKRRLPEAGEILEMLDSQMKDVLGNSEDSEVQEGMDLTLAIYDPATRKLNVTNAKRTSYIIRDGNVIELKANHRSIGEVEERRRQRKFETEEIEMKEGDMLYMFTDGITDQFGGKDLYGEDGRLLTANGLKEMLLKTYDMPIEEQEGKISEMFEQWQGTMEQIDDVALVGIRF